MPSVRAAVLAVAAAGLTTVVTLPALALQQPNGATIPSPPGCSGGTTPSGLLAIFACQCTQPGACNIGAPCTSPSTCDDGQHGTCESTMWHAFNDNTCIPTNHSGIDPVADAAKASQTFHPTCALTFTVISRGNAMFQNVFGWYNVTGHAPAPADLHPMLGCADGPGTTATLDLTKQPGWLGGDVGFFLMTPEAHGQPGTCASGNCCPSATRVQNGEGWVYTTESGWDPDQQGSTPYIHVLAYDSHIWPKKFYFGMEDTYDGGDNDFADLVTSVEGVECSGAGLPCDTGKPGVCALGVTECAQDQVTCTQLEQPSPEKCNGVDDDCDGKVDDGATCPDPGDVCQNGRCVHACGSVEFQCAASTQCDPKSGLCVDPACIGVACPADQICSGGQCGTPCSGVVCPHGQTCVGNACVDLCHGVTCPAGQTCAEGVCMPGCGTCGGLTCAAPLACVESSGACGDPSCPSGCPAGTWCSAGQCVDGCQGAHCPAGQTCQSGACVGPGAQPPDGGIVSPASGAPAGDDGGAAAGNDAPFSPTKGGCACEVTGAGDGGSLLPMGGAALALAGAVAARRRRVCARAATRRD
jgi:MYXO-CTERM domain-containing protein